MAIETVKIGTYQNTGSAISVGSGNHTTSIANFSNLQNPVTRTLVFNNTNNPDGDPGKEWDFNESPGSPAATLNGTAATLTANGTAQVGASVNLGTILGLGNIPLLNLDLGLSNTVNMAVINSGGVQYLHFYNNDGSDANVPSLLNGLVTNLTTQIQGLLNNPLILEPVRSTLQALLTNTNQLLSIVQTNALIHYNVTTSGSNGMEVCFTADTLIVTRSGLVRAYDLAPGDEVLTLDSGYQPIRWVGRSAVSTARLIGEPRLRAVRIAPGALGSETPERTLMVSPQHRCLVRSRVARNITGEQEVLVAAKHLVGMPGIDVVTRFDPLVYVHILLDRHELVYSDGAVTETLFLGPMALGAFDDAGRAEIMTLSPELLDDTAVTPLPARSFLGGKDARKLVERSLKNLRTLVEDLEPQTTTGATARQLSPVGSSAPTPAE